jgi:hypothetical protein
MDGQQVGIRTSAIDEKCQAFETLVIYCSTLGGRFAPYLQQSLEVVLQSLRFVLHDGVREACAMYVFLPYVRCNFLADGRGVVGFCPCWCRAGKRAIR